MQVIYDPQQIYSQLDFVRRQGLKIGLVPTMGALHAGHLSLVQNAKELCQRTVATIFVNPTQFGPQEDLAKYPRTLEADLERLEQAGTDFVFVPEASVIYPPGFSTRVEPPSVAKTLEGAFRPEHFGGVATIVLKLFHMIPSHIAYFGQKDFQQVLVIRHMVNDLNVPIRIETCPTIREPDGLAMSSRNRYLDEAERIQARSIHQALKQSLQLYSDGERQVAVIENMMRKVLRDHGINSIDYATVVCSETLQSIEMVDCPAVALVAVRIGTTRLIDNQIMELV